MSGGVVQSDATLVDMPAGWWPANGTRAMHLTSRLAVDYYLLYKLQPNVRVCVDFLARNVAQLALHQYRRLADDSRIRLRASDHPLAMLFSRPLPPAGKVTQYRLIHGTVSDLGIYDAAYWWKRRNADKILAGLLRLPPDLVTTNGYLLPSHYSVALRTGTERVEPDDMVHFHGYNPTDPVEGLSPLETLRRVLAEEWSAGDYRESFWKNAARVGGVLERPATAEEWSDAARERFRAEWTAMYSGEGTGGETAILEDGMTFKPIVFNPQEAEYLGGRKLTREECARAYHIPPTLVGILDHATYSNIESQHRNLYNDVLGPILVSLEQDIELQLADEYDDMDGVYSEFNFEEKLKGDFKTQAQALFQAVGRPWMKPNEARARMNLPKDDDPTSDVLGMPAGVTAPGAGQTDDEEDVDAEPTEADQVLPGKALLKDGIHTLDELVPEPEGEERVKVSMSDPDARLDFEGKWSGLFTKIFTRQRNAVVPKIKGAKEETPSIGTIWDIQRWDTEVAADLFGLSWETAKHWAKLVTEALGTTLDYEVMRYYLENNARIAAESINASTMLQLENALTEENPAQAVEGVFDFSLGGRQLRLAIDRVTALSNYGAYTAASRNAVTKTWVTTSKNPRHSHMLLDGETVPIRSRFSNGLRWPGDYLGTAEETANCQCEMVFGR